MKKYIWYAGYGSNLSRQRFLCYIEGGTPLFGKRSNLGCDDKSLPVEDRIIQIPYRLYFAWPHNELHSQNWGKGGVAFLNPEKTTDKNDWSYCRIWKITSDQYEEIRNQEGRAFYDLDIRLDDLDDVPLRTITHSSVLSDIIKPSEAYLKTIAIGLRESYNFDATAFINYIKNKEGVRDNYSLKDLQNIFETSHK